jgi:hypothetical protein
MRFLLPLFALFIALPSFAADLINGRRTTNAVANSDLLIIGSDARSTPNKLWSVTASNLLQSMIGFSNWPAAGSGEVSTAQLNTASNHITTNVQGNLIVTSNALRTDIDLKAPLASPTFSGAPVFQGLAVNFITSKMRLDSGSYLTNTDNGEAWVFGDTTTAKSRPAHYTELGTLETSLTSDFTAGDTITSNALRTAYLAADITTSNGVLAAAIANDMTMSNSFVKTIDTRGQTNSNARFTSTIFATGLSSNNTVVSSLGKTASGEIVEAADYSLTFGNGTRGITNGATIAVELSLQVSNTLWFLSNIVVVANVTNATSGDVTNTISLAPGEVEYLAYETNATVRNTNFSGYVANTKSKWARYILTGPSAITATFNTGAVHGLYWGRNSNNVVDASMTLAANSRYLYSGSRWGSNILQSLIKVDQ